ncbi:MAG: SprT family zinc-dependent metalloprotease [Ignavibacteriaceae bacterium]|nr:SprT family zinc-dependent metalloprotease [Ignavibacteriaceae bacterium]
MSEQIIHIDGVGKVLFKQSKRTRHISISIKPFTGAKVTVPAGVDDEIAFRFVREKKHWINKHLARMKELEAMQTKFDENSSYSTRHHKLHLRKTQRRDISVRLSKGKINVVYPNVINPDSKVLQQEIRKGIERALRLEAKQYLPDKVNELAEKFGFKFNKLTLKNIKSRWGSCSRKNNINLSIHLIRLPDHLIDYVILHELVHTVHHNHSAKFWKMLNDITGGSKVLDDEFKKYRISIY